MYFKYTVIILLLAWSCSSESTTDVPVLIFGKSLAIQFPALKSLASNEFSNLVQSQLTEDTVTVVFLEPRLSIEDLTQCRKTSGITCYENLDTIETKSYFPNVAHPVEGIYEVPSDEQIQLRTNDNLIAAAGPGKIVFVNLDLAKSSEDFSNHDQFISDTYNLLSEKYKSFLIIYTGRQDTSDNGSLVRKTRQTSNSFNNWDLKSDKNFAIAAEKIIVKKAQESPDEHRIQSVSSTLSDNSRSMKVEIETDKGTKLELSFKKSADNWELYGAKETDNNLIYPKYIFARVETPMRCGESLTFRAGTTLYSIVNSQFLPSFNANSEPIRFSKGEVVHCNGYYTPGIVAALFVIFIFAIIMIWGISFIMSINTMDKFDDPKGKTITINATD